VNTNSNGSRARLLFLDEGGAPRATPLIFPQSADSATAFRFIIEMYGPPLVCKRRMGMDNMVCANGSVLSYLPATGSVQNVKQTTSGSLIMLRGPARYHLLSLNARKCMRNGSANGNRTRGLAVQPSPVESKWLYFQSG